jgi:hypothetical protein
LIRRVAFGLAGSVAAIACELILYPLARPIAELIFFIAPFLIAILIAALIGGPATHKWMRALVALGITLAFAYLNLFVLYEFAFRGWPNLDPSGVPQMEGPYRATSVVLAPLLSAGAVWMGSRTPHQ